MSVSWKNQPCWDLTAVYGSPQRTMRHFLWDGLREISNNISGAWCAIGDFNALLSQVDKEGGRDRNGVCRDFQNCLMDCGLEDLGFRGNPFTWQRGNLKERLDRAVGNVQWHLRFQEASIFLLPNYMSDHVPLWMKFNQLRGVSHSSRPFRFLASWLTHESFNELVKGNWKYSNDWNSNLHSFTGVLKDWNKNIFGNITLRKNRLLNRLHGIAKKLDNGFNPFLQWLQKKLWGKYE